MQVAVLGHRGLVGSAVSNRLGGAVRGLDMPRIRLGSIADPVEQADKWIKQHCNEVSDLCERIDGCQSLVNAAGLAGPRSNDVLALHASNAVLPVIALRVAQEVGVRRVVHVSSAAVQGSTRLLDESLAHQPQNPYARSKAAGEWALHRLSGEGREDVVIYRATSVLNPNRSATRRLVSLYGMPIAPVFGSGQQPLPVSTLRSTAAAVTWCIQHADGGSVVLHPWEGVTGRSLADSLRSSRTRLISCPAWPFTRGPFRLASRRGPLTGSFRLVELLAAGQSQESSVDLTSFNTDTAVHDELRHIAQLVRMPNSVTTNGEDEGSSVSATHLVEREL